jgi:hypothetical protein
MMSPKPEQPMLPFDPKALARTTDPDTSHEAAMSAKELRGIHHGKIMAVFNPGVRLASEQVSDRIDLTHAQVWRRMNELEKAGLLRRTDEKHKNRSGRMAYRYEVPDDSSAVPGRVRVGGSPLDAMAEARTEAPLPPLGLRGVVQAGS